MNQAPDDIRIHIYSASQIREVFEELADLNFRLLSAEDDERDQLKGRIQHLEGLLDKALGKHRRVLRLDETAAKFPLGVLVQTQGSLETVCERDAAQAIARYVRHDWGECCPEDARANDEALATGGRLLGVYRTAKCAKFWIITEADRSTTTVLLPAEY